MRSIRSQLRVDGLLQDFLKEHRPEMFNRRFAQCFPAGTPSLELGRSSEKIYNFMDVRQKLTISAFFTAQQNLLVSSQNSF